MYVRIQGSGQGEQPVLRRILNVTEGGKCGCTETGARTVDKVWELTRDQTAYGFVSHSKDFGFLLWDEKPLEVLSKWHTLVNLTFLKDHSGCCFENRMKSREGQRWNKEFIWKSTAIAYLKDDGGLDHSGSSGGGEKLLDSWFWRTNFSAQSNWKKN